MYVWEKVPGLHFIFFHHSQGNAIISILNPARLEVDAKLLTSPDLIDALSHNLLSILGLFFFFPVAEPHQPHLQPYTFCHPNPASQSDHPPTDKSPGL